MPFTGTLLTPPIAQVAGGTTPVTFSVKYLPDPNTNVFPNTDTFGLNIASMTSDDVSVVSGANTLAVSTPVVAGIASGADATYTVAPPLGNWSNAASGVYSISVVAGNVTETRVRTVFLGGTTTTIIGDTANPNIASFRVDGRPPTGTLVAPPTIVFSSTTATFDVNYADDSGGSGVNSATFAPGNVTVTGPAAVVVTNAAPTGNTVRYTITAPGGGTWNQAPAGSYTIALVAASVKDLFGNGIAAGNLGSFTVTPDTVAPTGQLTAPPNIVSNAASASFVVTYTDNTGGSGVNPATLGAGNVTITGPGAVLVTGADVTGGPTTYMVRYTISAPNSTWALGPGGTYTIALVAGNVKDLFGNGIAAGNLGTFIVVKDTTPPTATLSAANNINIAGAGTSTNTFSVTYADEPGGSGVDPATFSSANVKVTNGATTALVRPTISIAGNTVTYTVDAPNGTWGNSPQGIYTIDLVAGSVKDRAGNGIVAGTVGTFTVGTVAPTAKLTSPPTNVNASNFNNTAVATGSNTFTITYNSLGAPISPSSFGIDDISVSNGATNLIVTNVSAQGNAVTYTVLSPLGQWTNMPQGTYFINIQPNSVSDTVGNFVAPVMNFAFFTVDVFRPTAMLTTAPANITASNAALGVNTFSITYSDAELGIDTTTFGVGNVQVTNGATTLNVISAATVGNTVTYTVQPPNGNWAAVTQGTYTVSVVANSVKDLGGSGINAVPSIATFRVDNSPPTATLTFPPANITATNGATTSNTFTITYSDSVSGVNTATFGTDDVAVTNGLLSLVVTNFSVSGNQVTYTVQAPNGTWAQGAQGIYNIAINANAVRDLDGNGIAAVPTIGSFSVSVFAPTAVLTSPPANINVANYLSNQVASGTNTFTITYNSLPLGAPINAGTFSVNNVTVMHSVTGTPLTVISAVAQGNAVTYTVLAPGGMWTNMPQGTYIIGLADAPNSVKDTAGVAVLANPNFAFFTVDTYAPVAVQPLSPAAPTINTLNAGPGTTTFTISYTDVGLGIDFTKLGIGNITVSNGATQATVVAAIPGGTPAAATVTYIVQAPNNNWTTSPQGIWNIGIVGGNVKDLAGNGIIANPNFAFFVVDTVVPTATLTSPPANINLANAPLGNNKFTITYADAAPGQINAATFGIGNVTVTNGATPLNVTSVTVLGNAVTYTVAPPLGNWALVPAGTYTVALNANSVQDVAGNAVAGVANLTSFLVDITRPALVITPNGTLTNASPILFTFQFSEPVTFNASSILVTNGTKGAFTMIDPTQYTLVVTPIADGAVTVTAPANSAIDVVGNGNLLTSATIQSDRTGPLTTISPPSALSTASGPITYTITWTDPNFSAATLTAGQVILNKTGTANGAVTSVTGVGNMRVVTIDNIYGNGTISISLPPGVAVDAAGNLSAAAGPSAAFTVAGNRILNISQPPAPTTISAGATYVYAIDYSNLGDQIAANARILVNLPSFGTFIAASSTAGWTKTSGSQYQLSLGNLGIGASGRVTFAVNYPMNTPPGTVASFTAGITDALADGAIVASSTVVSTIVNAGRLRWGRCC